MSAPRNNWLLWLTPIALTVGATLGLLLFGRLADRLLAPDGAELLRNFLFVRDPLVAREVVMGVLEVLAGIFAITITVVAIIVQLSATRYTSRVVDLFLADPFNVFMFFAYVVPLIYGFWLSSVLVKGVEARISAGLFMILATLSITLVIPYFKYVFVFLHPRHIIARIERSIEGSLQAAARDAARVEPARTEVTNSIRQLSDIALSSIAQADFVLAMLCIDSIRQAAGYYLRHKPSLPPEWFAVQADHIVGLSEEVWREVVARGTWMEMEVFKQYEVAFTTSLRKARDVNSDVARGMRQIAQEASAQQQGAAVELFIKGLNTVLTYALSERDVRAAVHVLYQHRLLAESLLHRPELVLRMAEHLRYYAESSRRRSIHFIVDAVAYDLRILVEHAHAADPDTAGALLGTFLRLGDQVAAAGGDAARVRGVRKSQALLAAWCIRQGRLDWAGRIHDAMKAEPPEALTAVRDELFAVESQDFWEIEDRGVSFYYVDPSHRASVSQFFAWLLGEQPLPREAAESA